MYDREDISNFNVETVFTISRNEASSNSEAINSNRDTEFSTTESEEPDCVLSVLFLNNKLGAAYYKIADKQLYVLNDISECEPEFIVTKCLLNEVNPRYVISIGNTCQPFIKCLIDNITKEETTVNSDDVIKVPPNLSLLPYKEYSVDSCLYKIFEINLPSSPIDRAKQEIYLQSLVNFSNKISIHALGALVKFVEVNWGHLVEEGLELQFLHINQVTLGNRVFMDKNAFKSLQVFESRQHNASFKHGYEFSNREGFSILKLFSQHCKSKGGFNCLRNLLLSPINNMEELKKRLDFVQFALTPRNQGFISTLNENLKKLFELKRILVRIYNMTASRYNWETLYKTIIQILRINEICGPYRGSSTLLTELDSKITRNLYGLEKSINLTLDFKANIKRRRPTIKLGLDSELDAKKLRHDDIAKNVTAAANFAIERLPSYIDTCMVVHVPETGYLVAIKQNESQHKEELIELGYQFMFELSGFIHFKNAMCKELDKHLGNLLCDIVAHENRILSRLSEFVLKFNSDVREPLQMIYLIDCLISFAKVAKDKGYVRPDLNTNNVYNIQEGKHPLVEDCTTGFVRNDYCSGGGHSNIKLITGPNASGKTVYLKQTAIILYLAHVGSFVPAKKASIGMLHSIHCRLHATESAALRLSAFTIDVQQMAQSLYNAKSNSLILIDEFGRGTTGIEGEALLTAALKYFIQQEMFCPHVLVSSHFQKMSTLNSRLVTHMKMDYVVEDDLLVFLYRIVEGVSTSYAFDVAESVGFDEDIVKRAREIFHCLVNNIEINSNPSNRNRWLRKSSDEAQRDFFSDIEIPEPDD